LAQNNNNNITQDEIDFYIKHAAVNRYERLFKLRLDLNQTNQTLLQLTQSFAATSTQQQQLDGGASRDGLSDSSSGNLLNDTLQSDFVLNGATGHFERTPTQDLLIQIIEQKILFQQKNEAIQNYELELNTYLNMLQETLF